MSTNNHSDEPMILILENSVIKVRKALQPTSRKIDIEQWTTAFTVYMSVMTHKFPSRGQELLNYLRFIRHAAQTHRGLVWCVYDHIRPFQNWSLIDQQLWLMICTTSPDILVQQYPHFPPQMDSTIGLPPRAFEEASVEISTAELGVSVSHANIKTYPTHVMANILDLHVPHSIPS